VRYRGDRSRFVTSLEPSFFPRLGTRDKVSPLLPDLATGNATPSALMRVLRAVDSNAQKFQT